MEEIKRVVRDKRDCKNRDELKLLAFLEISDKQNSDAGFEVNFYYLNLFPPK